MRLTLPSKMIHRRRPLCYVALGGVVGLVACWAIGAESGQPATAKPAAAERASAPLPPTRGELAVAIDRGLQFLLKSQNSNGWWSTPEQPAVTALVGGRQEPGDRVRRSQSRNAAFGFQRAVNGPSKLLRWHWHEDASCRIVRAVKRRPSPAQTALSLLGPAAAIVALLDCVEGVQFRVKDCEGRCRAMNRAWLLDYSLGSFAEAEGKTDFDLSPCTSLRTAAGFPG